MKKRNKKYDPQAAKNRQIGLAVAGAMSRMYLWGSSTVPMRTAGTASLRALLDPPAARRAQSALFEMLMMPRTWRFWTLVVSDVGHGRVEIETYRVTMDESMLSDFTEHLEGTVRSAHQGDGEIVAYAYIAAPNDDVDFDRTEDDVVDYWMERGLAEELALPVSGFKLTALDFAKALMEDTIAIPTRKSVDSEKDLKPVLVQ